MNTIEKILLISLFTLIIWAMMALTLNANKNDTIFINADCVSMETIDNQLHLICE